MVHEGEPSLLGRTALPEQGAEDSPAARLEWLSLVKLGKVLPYPPNLTEEERQVWLHGWRFTEAGRAFRHEEAKWPPNHSIYSTAHSASGDPTAAYESDDFSADASHSHASSWFPSQPPKHAAERVKPRHDYSRECRASRCRPLSLAGRLLMLRLCVLARRVARRLLVSIFLIVDFRGAKGDDGLGCFVLIPFVAAGKTVPQNQKRRVVLNSARVKLSQERPDESGRLQGLIRISLWEPAEVVLTEISARLAR